MKGINWQYWALKKGIECKLQHYSPPNHIRYFLKQSVQSCFWLNLDRQDCQITNLQSKIVGIISNEGTDSFTFFHIWYIHSSSMEKRGSVLINTPFKFNNIYTQVSIFNKCQDHFMKCWIPTLTGVNSGKLKTVIKPEVTKHTVIALNFLGHLIQNKMEF